MTERTAYRLHNLRYRNEEDEGFECPMPLTCQFPKCDCDRIREEQEAERRAEEQRQLENEAMAEHFRKHPHG